MHLYVRSGGKLNQWRGDAAGSASAFASLPPAGAAAIVAQAEGGDILILRR